MLLCLHVYMFICVFVCMFMWLHTCVFMLVCLCIDLLYVCMFVCLNRYIFISCMFTHVHIIYMLYVYVVCTCCMYKLSVYMSGTHATSCTLTSMLNVCDMCVRVCSVYVKREIERVCEEREREREIIKKMKKQDDGNVCVICSRTHILTAFAYDLSDLSAFKKQKDLIDRMVRTL